VTLVRAPHVTQKGALWVFASQQPDLAEPQPYGLYAVSDPGGDFDPRNNAMYSIDGEVLWRRTTAASAWMANLQYDERYVNYRRPGVWAPASSTMTATLPGGRPCLAMAVAGGSSICRRRAGCGPGNFAASLNLSATWCRRPAAGVDVLPVAAADGTPYLAAHTVGLRRYESGDGQPHVVAYYGQEGADGKRSRLQLQRAGHRDASPRHISARVVSRRLTSSQRHILACK